MRHLQGGRIFPGVLGRGLAAAVAHRTFSFNENPRQKFDVNSAGCLTSLAPDLHQAKLR
ncbi:hypothetical protein CBM2589_A10176 [Cupriavidus taiwanensis]|uniref:Uncharacterized protein n=1 Tax=Cupriavidus taiwanensis TaxID=164546 RepID=A0A975X546_9BURK|nr:hypothetical protein CBM2589_A10176 [Cupriavidus taiwanensis]